MKAQARKILALIMAMVMCLSLAAPAFAEAEEAAEAPEASTSEVVEEEAPKTEEEEVEAQEAKEEKKADLETQDQVTAVPYVYGISFDEHGTGYKVTVRQFNGETGADITDKQGNVVAATYPAGDTYYGWTESNIYASAAYTDMETPMIVGQTKSAKRWTVTAKDAYKDKDGKAKTNNTVVVDETSLWSLEDTQIAGKFTELGRNQSWTDAYGKNTITVNGAPANLYTEDAGNFVLRRLGSIYQEENKETGKWTYYFKLYPAQADGTSIDESTGHKWYYAKVTGGTKQLTRDDEIVATLFGDKLTVVAPDGKTTGDSFTTFYKDRTYTSADFTTWGFSSESIWEADFTAADKCEVTAANKVKFSGTNNVASFKVRIKIGQDANGNAIYETDKAAVQAELEKAGKAPYSASYDGYKVVSVSDTATANYWTVNIEKDSTVGTDTQVGDYEADETKNTVMFWQYANGVAMPIRKAGLKDLSKNGEYTKKETDTTTTAITAGSEANKMLGPVAFYKEDLPNNVVLDGTYPTSEDATYTTTAKVKVEKGVDANDKTYYVVASPAHLMKALKNNDCGAKKTINFKQLVLNPYNTEDKQNTAVALISSPGNGLQTQSDNNAYWAITTNWLNTTNYKNTETVSGSIELAAKTGHTTMTETSITYPNCKEKGKAVQKVVCQVCSKELSTTKIDIPMVSNPALQKTKAEGYVMTENEARTAYAAKYHEAADAKFDIYSEKAPLHYIAKVDLQTVDQTKTEKGKVVRTYTCNLGCVHDELTETQELDKVDLQHSGRWDYASWGTQNTANVKNPNALYGYNVFVYDTDVDLTDVPMNGASETAYFHFDGATAQADGTYYGELGFGHYEVEEGGQKKYYYGPIGETTVWEKDAAGKKTSSTKYYAGNVIVKNIKTAEKDCVDGSATIEINIYKVLPSLAVAIDHSTPFTVPKYLTPDNVGKLIANKQVELVKTYTQDVVVPAEKTHVDANADGKCDNCGNTVEQGTVEPVTGLVDISKATVTFDALTYTGKAAQPTVTVTLDGVKLAKSVDYEVEEMQDVNAGTYPLIVKGKGDFTGRVVGNVTINQAKQPMTVKATAPSAKKLKKKAQKVGLTIKKAQGKVTVKVSGPATVKGTTVTAKKGTKKGKKIKITVTAAGNDNYKKGSKTVTVKVKA